MEDTRLRETIQVVGSIPAIVRNAGNLYEGNLRSYLRKFFKHARNLRHPYHNPRHVCHVMWLCYDACMFYAGEEGFTPRKMRSLLIGGLLHDFDHTGRVGPDIVNIELAVAGLRQHIDPVDVPYLSEIEAIIRATEYPPKSPCGPDDLLCQIIRDADLCQAFSVAWFQQVIMGLSEELDKDLIEILKMQAPFLRSIKFQTEWARSVFSPKAIDAKIAEAEDWLEILTEEEPAAATA